MKLKLSNQEFLALYRLLQTMNSKYVCLDMEDKLLHVLLTAIYIRLHTMSIIRKEKYSVKLTEAEALCLWITTHDHKLSPQSFEGNLLDIINNSIHQKFSI